jgi:hypothetical protein
MTANWKLSVIVVMEMVAIAWTMATGIRARSVTGQDSFQLRMGNGS